MYLNNADSVNGYVKLVAFPLNLKVITSGLNNSIVKIWDIVWACIYMSEARHL